MPSDKPSAHKKPKIHKPILYQVFEALGDIFERGYFADKVIEYRLKQKGSKWGSRDRRFFAEAVYDIVRWYRRLRVSLPENLQGDYWALLKAWLILKDYEYPEMKEFPSFNQDTFKSKYSKPTQFADISSYPDWMVGRVCEELGREKGEAVLQAMNQTAEIYMRCNFLNIEVEALSRLLDKEGIQNKIIDPVIGTLCLNQRKNVFVTSAFKKGFFEVQDYGSQQIVPLLEVAKKQRVLDFCAGAGGKTLQMAQLMENKGKIVATDIHEKKLAQLKKRARRNGVDVIETRIVDRKWCKRQREKFDRILLDVPCSGTGVIKRNPDTKWKLKPERIDELIQIQRDIFMQASPMLKPGGRLVYATCSLLPSENQNQVEWFLSQQPGWRLDKQLILTPDASNTDGFYAAALIRE